MSRFRAACAVVLLLLATLPPTLRADWIVTPYAGITSNTRAVFTDAGGPVREHVRGDSHVWGVADPYHGRDGSISKPT